MLRVLRWLRGRGRGNLGAWFGQTELRVLEALWRKGEPASVRDLQGEFPRAAYTTLMTTLDRLHRKGVLDRVKSGRAFVYSPRLTREQLQAGLAEDALQSILGPDAAGLRPVLSMLVDAVSRQDREVLAELERLARQRRAERKDARQPSDSARAPLPDRGRTS
jgi:predicted transcriptional regulator